MSREDDVKLVFCKAYPSRFVCGVSHGTVDAAILVAQRTNREHDKDGAAKSPLLCRRIESKT
jgi:hypothetical protein